ncbi:heme-binding protein [Tahibacter amnicola]|uniref:Heme-binding protein n=1 Tax=Tahibacter amnicola TaxID=2976241 RepID=A0ABY6BJX9_9GAMM|nr:heme-binding protein [Tahibacter amnicola]UXI70323.1 heme-binding protein [Tahibacter amnicola]
MGRSPFRGMLAGLCLVLAACSGGSNSTSSVGTAPPNTTTPTDTGCTGSCTTAQSFLTTADVEKIVAQAAAEAQAQNRRAVIAVVDRVGNVLAVYGMPERRATIPITSGRGVTGGLEGLEVPPELAAIAKAVTGAYLSSEGNAFSTRTASQIVQEHFNPGEFNAPSGPLFGVQFSQLPCSDLSTRFTSGVGVGPHRSPLGLSADPGGFPLYKAGAPVGGIGVLADERYSLDPSIGDTDRDIDELIALAGTFGYAAPVERRGDRITADGKTFRFTDVEFSHLARDPATAPSLASQGNGTMMAVPGYFGGTVLAGTAFGQAASGIRPDAGDYPNLDAFVLDDGAGNNRYAPRAGTDGANGLTATEARTVVQEALGIANRTRAQIRRPLSTPARVSISVVDTNGTVLALARTRDAPVFGLDVSLQKARAALLFSAATTAADLAAAANARYLNAALDLPNGTVNLSTTGQGDIAARVGQLRSFLGLPTALADTSNAFSNRAVGNLARPYYPDGIISSRAGPLSLNFASWSPFQDGLQLDLVYNAVASHLAFYLNQRGLALTLDGAPLVPAPTPGNPMPIGDVAQNCTGIARAANGIQIFPGSVPIYRGSVLVGAIGVSGDGVDQDDMISFLGVHNAAARLNGSIGNAPREKRVDRLEPAAARLRYVQCPQAPFIGSTDDNVCEGK